ncbi:MAG: catalase family protein [Proteobacteria bacterium]|nr:catalase family protein [Pseudomonadota bacterium]
MSDIQSPHQQRRVRKIELVTVLAMALRTGLRRRGQHPKPHGCVRARFEVLADIPDACKVGLFARPGTYDALIRFSNGPQRTDRDRGAQGMAIKLLGVPGRKILPSPPDAETHDFIMIDGPVFFVRDTDSYARLVGELARLPAGQHPLKWLKWLKQHHPQDVPVVDSYHDRLADSPLALHYWSQVPYRFGAGTDTICRYSAVPHPDNMAAPIAPEARGPHYLRQAMINQLVLAGRSASFDFCVQRLEQATPEIIDNPTVEWTTPVHRVATITIPAQDFNRAEQDRFGELLSYTPWHALPDHEPVGQINEIRRSVYALSSRVRHLFRLTSPREPTSPFPPRPKPRGRRRLALGGAAAAVILAAAVGTLWWKTRIPLPDYPAVERQVWLDQNWPAGAREWYHHASQGGQFPPMIAVPYEWFIALEQPTLSLGAAAPLADQHYLDRFGFIPSTTEGGAYDWRSCREPEAAKGYDSGTASPSRRHRLPVGFACTDPRTAPMVLPDGRPWRNPATGRTMSALGLTCAACHTGRLTYGKTELLIDGGSAMTDIVKLNTAIALSLVFTKHDPLRFNRFALRLLGPDSNEQSRARLARQLDDVVDRVRQLHDLDDTVSGKGVVEGFGRLDALNRIGNQVFAIDLGKPENYAGSTAPVHYPRIWDVQWFEWAQYNGSIGQPMVRNAGEALGTGAPIVLAGAPASATPLTAPLFSSGVQVGVLFEMEKLLAGNQPTAATGFTGLTAPKWPADVLGPIDKALAERGAHLYYDLCAHCHLPSTRSEAFWKSENWMAPNAAGQRYLRVNLIPISEIGTDPAQAQGMIDRKVVTPPELGLAGDNFGLALGQLVKRAVDRWYDSQQPPVPTERRHEMDGYRDNALQEKLVYKARPLDGVWAAPPYLHNGSVPTIDALLSPARERPRTFWLGHRDYDPKRLGYRSDALSGGFEFDTSLPGNRNTGHEFDDGPERPGRIGPKLSPDDRAALIEYLKTL